MILINPVIEVLALPGSDRLQPTPRSIAQTQIAGKIPPHAQQDHRPIELPALNILLHPLPPLNNSTCSLHERFTEGPAPSRLHSKFATQPTGRSKLALRLSIPFAKKLR
jgi:hypothetical protein